MVFGGGVFGLSSFWPDYGLVMKDNAPAQILVMPQGGGQVSFAAQPASYTPGQPVVMNQEVSFQPPLQSDPPWEPPQSGS
ncbi:MAG: hypothetical protein Ct9H90mP16_09920 [Candidatus Poseidoniales archaeon]|nr:MAG: hypothetical protein Ct9H90mP16_09920 [Candidatus Poseidoniales archaeon]